MSYIHWSAEDTKYNPDLLSGIKDRIKDIQYLDLMQEENVITDQLIIDLRNSFSINKPRGLWASRIDNSKYYTWKDWCKNDYYNCEGFRSYFKFDLKPSANILYIYSPDIIKKQPNILTTIRYPNIDKDIVILNILWIMENYDGIELFHGNYYAFFHDCWHTATINSLEGIFYWWDCDSICVWNPDIIIPEKEKKNG